MKRCGEEMSAVLLCGGASERMGFAKEMLRVDGAPLAVKLVERLREVFRDVSVVTNRPEYLRHRLDAPIWRDEFRGAGPLAGLHSGLKNAGAERCLFLACDMPLAHIDMIRTMARKAEGSRAEAVVARADGRVQPLFGVYRRSLAAKLERVLEREGADRSVHGFLESVDVAYVDFQGKAADNLRDVDTPADLPLLKEAFEEVEPLPVKVAAMTRLPGAPERRDIIVEEWPVAIFANGARLATVMCMPTAVRELALGFIRYLGLLDGMEGVRSIEVDYRGRRVALELEADERRIRNAIGLLVTSTCGANVYGPELQEITVAPEGREFRVRRGHILECIGKLRAMAPVFERTGCTHQAALSDGERIRWFYEDIGRHNAMDKIVGAAMLKSDGLDDGLIVTTGRLNSEMVVKAVRAGVGVLASRSAVTSNSVRLARTYGLTLVGFARGGRLNVYTTAERVIDE